MKTSILALTTAALSVAFLAGNATANGPSMTNKSTTNRSTWSKSSSNTHSHRPLPSTSRTTTPRTHSHTPHYHTPRTTTPRTPTTVVVIPQTPRVNPGVTVVSGTTGVAGGQKLTNNAHVGYNRTTGLYSIAFDSPGVSGAGILINASYSIIVMGPTDWNSAREFLKRIEAPGW